MLAPRDIRNKIQKITLSQFIAGEQKKFPAIPPAVFCMLHAIALGGKRIYQAISCDEYKASQSLKTFNASGDKQQQLDVIAHNILVKILKETNQVCAIISEEAENTIEGNLLGEYIVAIDPLDGSNNIPVNALLGTIFSIYRRRSPIGSPVQLTDMLQAGNGQIAAGYILYGTTAVFVYATAHGVHGFTYHTTTNEFILTHPTMHFPVDGQTYAINDGYFLHFPSPIQCYIQSCREKGFSSRYSGALVADFHRFFIQGGIYLYPATKKMPSGKLRLMFECNALAFIAQQAGGMASDGKQLILYIQPNSIHQRTSLYIGSKNMVEALLSLF